MSKTKRELLAALAERLGGDHGRRLREALCKPGPLGAALDRPLTDREFTVQWAGLEREFKAALARGRRIDWDEPPSWGDFN